MSIKCDKCYSRCENMGDDESLFECTATNYHISSYHIINDIEPWNYTPQQQNCCETRGKFIGFLPYNDNKDYSDEELESVAGLMSHKDFQRVFNPNLVTDLTRFVWYCSNCKSNYINMYCG